MTENRRLGVMGFAIVGAKSFVRNVCHWRREEGGTTEGTCVYLAITARDPHAEDNAVCIKTLFAKRDIVGDRPYPGAAAGDNCTGYPFFNRTEKKK